MSDIKQYEPLWGAWYVDSLIGEGSFGKVYKIRKEEFGKTYFSAVKIITIPQSEAEVRQARSDGLDDASLHSYFHAQVTDILQEIDLMSSLRGNSNIVSFEDHKVIKRPDEIAWDILIRMELLTSLNDRIAQKPLTPDEVAKLGIDICKALELCAQRQIIHRDIKPENIFYSEFGEYKLGDFGIARQIERTSSGLSKKGTYTYMAPEVFKGEEYGASVDLYSLGLVMYRLLNANRSPFLPDYPETITPKDRETALQRRMRGEQIPPPRNGSDALQAVVLRACSFDRGARFASAGEMRKALEAAATGKQYTPTLASEPFAPQDTPGGTDDATSATVGVFSGLPKAAPQPQSNNTKRVKAEKPKATKKSKTGKRFWLLLALCICVIAGIVFLILNLQVRSIDLPEGGLLHKGDVIAQAHSLSPKRPLINDLAWSSSDESVLTVSGSGEITAVRPGSATVTLTSARGKVSDSITYQVEQRAEAITELPQSIRLAAGRSIQLAPVVFPTDTTDTLAYEVADGSIARADASGKIEGLQSGETQVKIKSGGIEEEIPVSVYIATDAMEGLPADARLALGKTLQLRPVIRPENSEEGIQYSSSDSSVLTVDNDGLIQAVAAGVAAIDVASGEIDETVKVEAYVPTSSIEMLPEILRVPINTTETLQPVLLPSTSRETVTYFSADESIALADPSGNVIGLAVGSTTVTVQSDGVSEEVAVDVYIPAEEIEGLPQSIRLSIGKTMQLAPTVTPAETTDTLAYESGDTSIVVINALGEVETLRAGETTINVRSGDVLRQVPVAVYVAAERISGLPNQLRIASGGSTRLQPVILPSTSKETVTYRSADENIAIADPSGNVTGLSVGRTVIAVECDGIAEEIPVEIYIPAEEIEDLPGSIRLPVGGTTQLSPVVKPLDTADTLVYESGDTDIAAVSASGEVETLRAGETTIDVRSGDVLRQVPIAVYVAAKRITGLPTEVRIPRGDSVRLDPVVLPSTSKETVTYQSASENIAIADQAGMVTGLSAGYTVVTVACDGIAEEVSIEIYVPVERIKGLSSIIHLRKGQSVGLNPEAVPQEANEPFFYKSMSDSIATVNKNGEVHALRGGSTSIVVTCGEISQEVHIQVSVPAEAILGLDDQYQLPVGKSLALNPTLYPADVTDTTITYKNSDFGVASVDAAGNIAAKRAGKTRITVSCGEASRTVEIVVYTPATATPKPTARPTATPRPTAKPTATPTQKPVEYMIVTGSTVIMRKTATMNRADAAGEVYRDEIVRVLDRVSNGEGSFVKIRTKHNVTGFIPSEYVKAYTGSDAASRFQNQTIQKPTAKPTAKPSSAPSAPTNASRDVPPNYTIYIWTGAGTGYQATYRANTQPDDRHPTYVGSITFVDYKAVSRSGNLPNNVYADYVRRYEALGPR